MAISETARENHDKLFPGHVSTLKVTDPEFIEYFDNLVFDEVLRYGSLDTKTRLMVQLASLIACQALSEYRMMLGAALTVGVTPIEVKEIVYQAVAYVGMAKVLDCIHATNDVLVERGFSCRSKDSRQPHRRRGPSGASLYKRRSSEPTSSTRCMRLRPTTRATSNACCLRTASATTTPGPALISRHVSS